jgi:hypothetical protein
MEVARVRNVVLVFAQKDVENPPRENELAHVWVTSIRSRDTRMIDASGSRLRLRLVRIL